MCVRDHGDGCVLDKRSGPPRGHFPHPCVCLPHPGGPVHRRAVPCVHEGLAVMLLLRVWLALEFVGTENTFWILRNM